MKKRNIIVLNLLILFLLSFLAGVFLYGTNVFVYRKLLEQKNELIEIAEDFIGCKIEYSSIRPYLNAVIIREVRLINKENKNVIQLGAVQINYSVFSWLKNGGSPLNLLTGVNIKNLHLDSSIEKLKNIKLPQKLSSRSKEEMPDISNILFSFSKSDLRLKLENGQYAEILVDSMRFNLFHNKTNIKSSLFLKYGTDTKTIISTRLSCIGELFFSPNVQLTLPEITFSETQAMGVMLKNQSFRLKYELPMTFLLERIKDQYPIEMTASGNNDSIKIGLCVNKLSSFDIISGSSFDLPEAVHNLLKPITNINFLSQADFNIKSKKISADTSGNLEYKAIPLLGDARFNFDFSINNSDLFIKNFVFSSNEKTNTADEQKITVGGNFNFAKMEPDFTVTISKIKLLTTQVSALLKFKKENSKYVISSNEMTMNEKRIQPFKYFFYTDKKYGKNQLAVETALPFNGISIYSEYNKNFKNLFYHFNIKNMQTAAFYNSSFTENLFVSSDFNLQLYNGNVIVHEGTFQAIDNSQPLLGFGFDFTNGIFDLTKIVFREKKFQWNIRGQLPVLFNADPDKVAITFYQPGNNFSLPVAIYNQDKEIAVLYAADKVVSLQKETKSFNISFSSLPLPFKLYESVPKLSAKINGIFADNPQLNGTFNISNFNIFNDKTGSISGTLSFKNKLLTVDKLLYKDSSNKITGIASGNFDQTKQFDMLLTDNAKKESYTINCQLADKKITGKAFITNMELKKILGSDYNGVLNLRLGIKNDLLSPDISLEGEVANGMYKNSIPIKAFVIGKKQSNKIEIGTLDFQRGRLKFNLGKSFFYLDKNGDFKNKIKNININGGFSYEFMARRIKSSFDITGNINSPEEILCHLDLHDNSISYLRGGNSIRQDKIKDTKLRIVRRNKRTTIDTVTDGGLKATIMKNNVIVNLFNDKQRIAYVNLSKNENKEIRGNIDLFHFPIDPISMITLPIVELGTGKLNGRLSFSGTMKDPLFSGEIALYHGNVKISDYLSRPILGATGIIRGNGKKLSVVNVCGTCGDGLVSGYGEILFSKNKFDRYRFVVSSDYIPAHFGMSFINVDGKGALNSFVFEGAPKNFIFDGDIAVDQANIDINTNQLGKSAPKKKKTKIGLPIDVNLKFTSGKKVNVNYPLISATLAENNIFSLRYSDIDKTLGLEGDLKLKNGKINYLNRIFKIEDASVLFDGTGFNPLINLTSYFRTKDKNKNNVKVYLSMNDRLLSFNTRFYSSPQLSENELNQLLGLPAIQTQDNENEFVKPENDLESIQNTTNYLGNTFLFSPLENIARRGLNLDTFSLNTEIFGNILSSNTQLVDMLDNSSLSIGKYIFEGFYIESMMTFNKKSDTNDSIFLALPNNNYGFNLQLQVLLELPFVSLGYSIKPRDLTNMTDMEQTISIESGFKF